MNKMVSYEWHMGGPTSTKVRDGNFRQTRDLEFFIQTEGTRYHCMLRDMIADDFEPNNEGFNSISIFPEGLLVNAVMVIFRMMALEYSFPIRGNPTTKPLWKTC